MATRMLQRRGTAAEWAAQNPVLSEGELGFETDSKVLKVGDGFTPWNDLTTPYALRSGTSFSGAVSLIAPTQPAHAARLSDVETRVAKAGDTMTGQLEMGNQRIVQPELLGYQEHESANSNASFTVDFLTAQLILATATGEVTLAWGSLPSANKVRVCTLVFSSTVTSVIWPVGTKFVSGEAPTLHGESWVSVVARGSTVTVGLAWSGVV